MDVAEDDFLNVGFGTLAIPPSVVCSARSVRLTDRQRDTDKMVRLSGRSKPNGQIFAMKDW